MIKSPTKYSRKLSSFKEWLSKSKRLLPISVLVVAVVAVVGLVAFGATKVLSQRSAADPRVEISDAKSTATINKTLEFPINDDKGKEITRLKFNLDNAEMRDEIIVKGRKVTSVKGRTFLVVTMRIVNDYEKAMEIKVADYVRLTANGNEIEFLAPEIHSDPVLVQSISTKMTRVGFPINDTDKSLVLWVGEVKGTKERVELSF